jgi:hypothetical protein
MHSPVIMPPGLVTGQRLSVEEFLRRWEGLPELKNAELIDGVVYVPPVSLDHGSLDFRMHWWLAQYAHATPGCKGGQPQHVADVGQRPTARCVPANLTLERLENGAYVAQTAPLDGIIRSRVFPGLWLAVAAFWADDGAEMQAALSAGLASEDHRNFVERLSRL